MKAQRFRIAVELHPSIGWVPIVPDSSTSVAHQRDVVLWVTPQPGSGAFAREVVATLNEVEGLKKTLEELADCVFASGLTADNTEAWRKARVAIAAATPPLSSHDYRTQGE
jgi:hypothetical protein